MINFLCWYAWALCLFGCVMFALDGAVLLSAACLMGSALSTYAIGVTM